MNDIYLGVAAFCFITAATLVVLALSPGINSGKGKRR